MTETDQRVAPPLAVTMGEPAGIGTEILFAAYEHFKGFPQGKGPSFYLIDDPARVATRARELDVSIRIGTISKPEEALGLFHDALPILPLPTPEIETLTDVQPGKPAQSTAGAVIKSIDMAVDDVVRHEASGVVTLPIQKDVLVESGFQFTGHTDYLGALCQEMPMPPGALRGPVMLLTAGPFRVAPATVHIPLKDVPAALRTEELIQFGLLLSQSLQRDYGLSQPKIAVAGLNPHAGEGGHLGKEEIDVIAPAVAALQQQGVAAFGPISADAMFHEEARSLYHAALTMYHDQGLIPIKTLPFYAAVNTTIGLPIVRTSPDHGTALPLVGKGTARPDSLVNAIYAADRMAKARQAFDAQHAPG